MDTELQKAVRLVEDLPAIPAIANRVMQAAESDDTSADDLRAILETDPGLSARVLRIANSSIYGFSRSVETLRHAITLLGFKQVESLVLASSLRDVFSNFGLSEKLLWEHATAAGVAASQLAAYKEIDVPRDSAFSAGLLHDVGKIAFTNVFRERYNAVTSRVYNDGTPTTQAEFDEFGFDHTTLGALVAEKWKLPKNLVHAIRHHHDAVPEYAEHPIEHARLTALISVITRCLTRFGIGRRGPVEALDPREISAWRFLGLDDDDLEPVLAIIQEEAKSAQSLFA